MREGQTICIDGRDYEIVQMSGFHADGRLWLARRDDGTAVVLVGPPWREWAAPVRAAAEKGGG